MLDDSLSSLLAVAAQAVRLKQVAAVRELRRAVAREVHVKQAGSAERFLGKAIAGQIDRQVGDIAKAVGSGARLDSKARLAEWKEGLVDAALPVLAIRMAEAAVAQMVMVGVDPRSKGARHLMRKHLPGQHDQSSHGRGKVPSAPGFDAPYGDPTSQKVFHADVTSKAEEIYEGSLDDETRQALVDYANSDYGLVNGLLRGEFSPDSSDAEDELIGKIEKLDSAMTGIVNKNIYVYRATPAKGSKYQDNGFVSTSGFSGTADEFKEKFGGKVRRIVVPGGTRVAFLGKLSGKGEQEILLPRGGTFEKKKMLDGTFADVYTPPIKKKPTKHLQGLHNQLDHGRGLHIAARVGDEWRMGDGSPLPEHLPKAIPPKWRAVMVSLDPGADLLVKGTDEKGRSQAIYSEAHWAEAAKAKFARINELRAKEKQIKSEIEADMRSKDSETRDSASCLRLIQATGLRPGGEGDTKAEKKAYGATTLEGRHVVTDGDSVRLRFVGKKGVDLDIEVTDAKVKKDLLARKKKAGDGGKLYNNTGASRLSAYSHSRDGGGFKTKDFRTAKGTSTAVEAIKGMKKPKTQVEYKKAVREVAKIVAGQLGNTPLVSLQSYIDPAVFSVWRVK